MRDVFNCLGNQTHTPHTHSLIVWHNLIVHCLTHSLLNALMLEPGNDPPRDSIQPPPIHILDKVTSTSTTVILSENAIEVVVDDAYRKIDHSAAVTGISAPTVETDHDTPPLKEKLRVQDGASNASELIKDTSLRSLTHEEGGSFKNYESTFRCQICFNPSVPRSCGYMLPDCGHIYCYTCLLAFLKCNISDGKVRLACFHVGTVDFLIENELMSGSDATGRRSGEGRTRNDAIETIDGSGISRHDPVTSGLENENKSVELAPSAAPAIAPAVASSAARPITRRRTTHAVPASPAGVTTVAAKLGPCGQPLHSSTIRHFLLELIPVSGRYPEAEAEAAHEDRSKGSKGRKGSKGEIDGGVAKDCEFNSMREKPNPDHGGGRADAVSATLEEGKHGANENEKTPEIAELERGIPEGEKKVEEVEEEDDWAVEWMSAGARAERRQLWEKFQRFELMKKQRHARECPRCGRFSVGCPQDTPVIRCGTPNPSAGSARAACGAYATERGCGAVYCYTHSIAHAFTPAAIGALTVADSAGTGTAAAAASEAAAAEARRCCAAYEQSVAASLKLSEDLLAATSKPCPVCHMQVIKSGMHIRMNGI